jgi:hypothetical protein
MAIRYYGAHGAKQDSYKNYPRLAEDLHYSGDIQFVDTWNYHDSLDSYRPMDCAFFIPAEVTLVAILVSARGMWYRAYTKEMAYEQSHIHDITTTDHTHDVTVSLTETSYDSSVSSETVTIDDHAEHKHASGDLELYDAATSSYGYTGQTDLTHTHDEGTLTVKDDSGGYSDQTTGASVVHSHGVPHSTATHTFAGHGHTDSMGGPTSTDSAILSSAGDINTNSVTSTWHYHEATVEGTTSSALSLHRHTGVIVGDTATAAAMEHTVTDHDHGYTYYRYSAGVYTTTSDGGETVNSGHGTPHAHELTYGIHQEQTLARLPEAVELYACNTGDFGLAGELYDKVDDLDCPPYNVSSFELCQQEDVLSGGHIDGYGWKWIRFTSTTLGRIAANITILGTWEAGFPTGNSIPPSS